VPIALKETAPIASGSLQLVYQHPDHDDLLIKVLKLDVMRRRWLKKSRGLPIKRRFGFYNAWVRELNEYIAIRSRAPEAEFPEFLQRHHGLVETDLGLGLMVGKVRSRTGDIAPTLRQVVRQTGLTDELRSAVAGLRRKVEALNLVTTDISANNILCGWSERHGDHLVIIEGLGDNTLIPVKSMSRILNRRSIRRRFARVLAVLEAIDARRTGPAADAPDRLAKPAEMAGP
jgi:hypothetical protein